MIRRRKVSSLTRNLLIVCGVVGALLIGIWLAVRTTPGGSTTPKSRPKASSSSTGSKQTKSNQQIQQLTQNQTKAQASTASSTAVPPDFTVYYPVSLDTSLTLDKSSTAYSKDFFSFAASVGGMDEFFVYEQPAGSNFSYQRLKVRLGTPTDAPTALGAGIIGTIGTSLITAVKTDKNTLIIVNCTALACAAPSMKILESLKVNSDPTHIQ